VAMLEERQWLSDAVICLGLARILDMLVPDPAQHVRCSVLDEYFWSLLIRVLIRVRPASCARAWTAKYEQCRLEPRERERERDRWRGRERGGVSKSEQER
jgi:hypothetical protein